MLLVDRTLAACVTDHGHGSLEAVDVRWCSLLCNMGRIVDGSADNSYKHRKECGVLVGLPLRDCMGNFGDVSTSRCPWRVDRNHCARRGLQALCRPPDLLARDPPLSSAITYVLLCHRQIHVCLSTNSRLCYKLSQSCSCVASSFRVRCANPWASKFR